MTDVLWKVFELSASLFESLIVIRFICLFFNNDFTSLRGKLVYVIGVCFDFACVTLINLLTVYEGFGGIIYILIYLIYEMIFLKGSFLRKIFSALISVVVLASVSFGVSSIVSTIFKRNVTVIYEPYTAERVCTIIFIQIFICCIFDLIIKFSIVTLNKVEWKLVLSILGISFISMACMHITLYDVSLDQYHAGLIGVAELGIIILNIVSFYMTYSLSKTNAEAEKLRIIRQQEEYRISYAKNVKEQYEEMHRMRHDMKQNLEVISALYREHKYDEANTFVNRVSGNLEKIGMTIDVHNDFLNAILNSKLLIASEQGIRVICASSSSIEGIDDIDLCNLLGNILDNAIEAAKYCNNGYIEVTIRSDENMVLVIVANTVVGSVIKINSELKSTKKNTDRHGYGVKTIRSIAEKYNGTASFYEEGNMFYCQVMMYK